MLIVILISSIQVGPNVLLTHLLSVDISEHNKKKNKVPHKQNKEKVANGQYAWWSQYKTRSGLRDFFHQVFYYITSYVVYQNVWQTTSNCLDILEYINTMRNCIVCSCSDENFDVSSWESRGRVHSSTIHQLTTMLATSKNVLYPGHNHLLTTSTDDLSLASARAIIKVSSHQHQQLAGGYDLDIGHF